MTTGRAVGLPPGAVVELDRSLEEPVDLYANGRLFATGHLLAGDEGNWAVRVDQVIGAKELQTVTSEGS